MDLCIHDCEMSGQLRASESFFSYFQVDIVGPIFLSFLKKKKKKKKNKPDFSMYRVSPPQKKKIRAVAGQRSSPDLCFATKLIKIYDQ